VEPVNGFTIVSYLMTISILSRFNFKGPCLFCKPRSVIKVGCWHNLTEVWYTMSMMAERQVFST